MVDAVIGTGIGVLAFFALLSTINLLVAPRLRCALLAGSQPRISLLIPVRDEADNLRETLLALGQLILHDDEVIFLDDDSSDNSAVLIKQAGFRVISGQALPADWSGKTWACHQLAQAAQNDILVFADADVFVDKHALELTRARFVIDRLDALTAWPYQRMQTFWENVMIPWVMHLPILGALPLPLLGVVKDKKLALGNGQWLAFTRQTYEAIGGHAAVRASWLEDMQLAQRVVRHQLKMRAYIATDVLEVRMYKGLHALRQGFTKNLYLLVGTRPWSLCMVIGVVAWSGFAPLLLWAGGAPQAALVAAACIVVWRIASARTCRLSYLHIFGQVILGHALGALVLIELLVHAWREHGRKRVTWKGRTARS